VQKYQEIYQIELLIAFAFIQVRYFNAILSEWDTFVQSRINFARS